MNGVSRSIWCVATVTLFLLVSIITIVEAAQEIVAGKHVALYSLSIFAWAPACAFIVVTTILFFRHADFIGEQ